MPDFIDVATVQGPDGAWYVKVPDGYALCLVTHEEAEQYADWTECAAFRLVTNEDGTVASIDVAPDLETITDPETSRA